MKKAETIISDHFGSLLFLPFTGKLVYSIRINFNICKNIPYLDSVLITAFVLVIESKQELIAIKTKSKQ